MLPIEVIRGIDKMAAEYDLPPGNLAAVVEVESNGKMIAEVNGEAKQVILFEPHIFYRRLTGEARAEAVKLKLASKAWNKRLYGKTQATRWAQVEAGEELLKRHGLPEGAAIESASYGLGQVMGYHWKSPGFDNLGLHRSGE